MDRILLSPEKGGLTSTGLVYRYDTEHSEDGLSPSPSPSPSHPLISEPQINVYNRRRWSRRSLQHVHILARRSSHASERLRAQVPDPSDQHLREYAEFRQPPGHVLGGDLAVWGTAGEYAAGI